MAKKYVILRGIEDGNKFFTTTSERDETDIVKLADGTVAYEILGYADTVAEAQIFLWGRSFTTCTD